MSERRTKQVLNAGSGPLRPTPVHPAFAPPEWRELRLDIDKRAAPDILGSFADMRGVVEDGEFDAIWSSHAIEHLHDHEVLPALIEFRRVLRQDGFAILTCPNIAAIAKLLATKDIESVVYVSQAGPIRILDMLFGHSASIEAGQAYMAHNTGFTAQRVGRFAAKAGFAEARVIEGDANDLWAALLMPETKMPEVSELFAGTNLSALFASQPSASCRADEPHKLGMKRMAIVRI
jgi:predicted SAM-dependent methyltransferase